MKRQSKPVVAGIIFFVSLSAFIVLIYSIFRDEWYRQDVQELSEYIDCSQKDILDIYDDIIVMFEKELINYNLVEVEFTVDYELQQVEFAFYKPGTFCDVKAKRIIILPQVNCIKQIETYEGNLKAYGGMVNAINAEELRGIFRENMKTKELKRATYSDLGIRVYEKQ